MSVYQIHDTNQQLLAYEEHTLFFNHVWVLYKLISTLHWLLRQTFAEKSVLCRNQLVCALLWIRTQQWKHCLSLKANSTNSCEVWNNYRLKKVSLSHQYPLMPSELGVCSGPQSCPISLNTTEPGCGMPRCHTQRWSWESGTVTVGQNKKNQ